jgi:AcrR family transcriptional regulator
MLPDMPAVEAKLAESPPGRARGDKRDRILEAAVRVFARTGYHRARVSDIANEAGIAYGLVYHYFDNKEDLLASLFRERFSVFLAAVEAIAAAETRTQDKLLAVAELVLHAYRLRPEWVTVLVLEIQRSSRITEPEQQRAVGRLFQLVARMLRDGQARGELREGLDPEVAAYLFIGGLEIVITAHVLDVLRIEAGGESEYYRKVAGSVVEIFLHGLAAREEDR